MLMSTKEILGFTIQATDGEIGQVSDFLVDEHFKLRDYETRLHAHYQYPPYWV
jgi:hypothetical protein